MVGRSLCEHFHAANVPFAGVAHDELDISREKDLEVLVEKYKPTVIFNAAAMTRVDQCETEQDRTMEINAHAPGRIAAICHRRGIQMVHLSTDYVFDGKKRSPYNEEDRPAPLSVYARSKADGERLVLSAMPDALVVRVAWVFRAGGKTFFSKMHSLIFKQDRIEAANDKVGNCTYAPDLATALVAMARRRVAGLIHFTNEGELSWYDFAEEFLETARRVGLHPACKKVAPISSSSIKFTAPRPAYTALDKSRYKRLTGNSIRHWRETLFDFIREKGEI